MWFYRCVPRRQGGLGSIYFDKSKRLFYAAVSVPGSGQRRSRGCRTEDEARVELARMQCISADVPSGDPDPDIATYFDKWLEARRARGELTPATLQMYRSLCKTHIENDPLLGHRPMRTVTDVDLDAYFARKVVERSTATGKTLGASTVNWLFKGLRGTFKAARRKRVIDEDPMDLVDRPAPRSAPSVGHARRTTPLTVDQYQLLRGYFNRCQAPGKERTFPRADLALLCAATGLRMGEALGLERQDVHLDAATPYVTVRQQLQWVSLAEARGWALRAPKSKKGLRTVGLPADAARVLTSALSAPVVIGATSVEWLAPPFGAGPPSHGGLIFVTRDGLPLRRESVYQTYQRVLSKLGLPPAAFHALRVTNATLLGPQLPTLVLRDHMGHAKIEQTAVYAHDLGIERAIETVAAFGRAVRTNEPQIASRRNLLQRPRRVGRRIAHRPTGRGQAESASRNRATLDSRRTPAWRETGQQSGGLADQIVGDRALPTRTGQHPDLIADLDSLIEAGMRLRLSMRTMRARDGSPE